MSLHRRHCTGSPGEGRRSSELAPQVLFRAAAVAAGSAQRSRRHRAPGGAATDRHGKAGTHVTLRLPPACLLPASRRSSNVFKRAPAPMLLLPPGTITLQAVNRGSLLPGRRSRPAPRGRRSLSAPAPPGTGPRSGRPTALPAARCTGETP